MKHRSKNLWRCSVLVVIMAASLFVLPWLALAGEGDGSGGGKDVPLTLVSSVPGDGQTGVELQPLIRLTFNKNVINLAIRDANQKCFTLENTAGSQIPIKVIMADDQLYPEEKRNISVQPVQALQSGTGYALKIARSLQAKNGSRLGREVTVNFVTLGTAVAPVQPEPVVPTLVDEQNDPSPAVATPEDHTAVSDKPVTSTMEQAAETPVNANLENKTEPQINSGIKEQPTEQTKPVAQPDGKSSTPYLVIAGIILVALGFVYYRKQNMK